MVVTLPRPLGVVLEWDSLRRRAVVTEFVRGGNAYQRSKASYSLGARSLIAAVILGLGIIIGSMMLKDDSMAVQI